MHKTSPSQFFNHTTPKLPLYYFPLGCEQVGEISRRCSRAPSGLKEPPGPEKPGGGCSGVKEAELWRITDGDGAGPRKAGNRESGARRTGVLGHRKLSSALLKSVF